MRFIKIVMGGMVLATILIPFVNAQAIEWQGQDWAVEINGAIRISYNRDDCDGDCHDSWTSFATQSDNQASDTSSTYLSGNVSHIEINGNRTLTGGMKAVFKSEWGLEPTQSPQDSSLNDLEQYLGLDGTFGLLRAGTLETPYMQSGNQLDPFYRDAMAARFFVDLQSALHHNTGKGRGRATNVLRYDSPLSLKGLDISLIMSLDDTPDNDHAFGAGAAYRSRGWTLFAQYYDNGESGDDEAYKVGLKLQGSGYSLFGQYEFDNGLISLSENIADTGADDTDTTEGDLVYEDNETTGADVWLVGITIGSGKYLLIAQYGERKDSHQGRFSDDGHAGWLVGVRFELDPSFYLYTGFLQKDYHSDIDKDERYTIGATLSF